MHLHRWLTALVSALLFHAGPPSVVAQISVASSSTTESSSLVLTGESHTERGLNLNGVWVFRLASDEKELALLNDFWKSGYSLTGFSPIEVPGNWSMQGFEPPQYGRLPEGFASEGFYVREFNLPANVKQVRTLLHFGGVWDSAEIWLNGHPLGRHDSGFTSFAFDVSPYLQQNSPNRLAVRVRQNNHDYLLDVNDDWSLPGIFRDVWLERMPADRWLDRVDVQTTFDDQFRDADLKIQVLTGESRPRSATASPYELAFTLRDPAGQVAATTRLHVPAHVGTDRLTNLVLHVSSPLHWTAETPDLYTLQVDLLEAGGVTHQRTRSVGFRQVSTAGGIFRVNGQVVKLRGIDRHDESARRGRATTPEDWERDLQLMKAANINFVRTSHYPPAEGFLDMCDHLGMYVEDEVPMGYGGDVANAPSFLGGVMLRAAETVTRDLNHPSILLWSVGNEDPFTAIHLAALRTVKGLDPTRPVLMPWRAEEALPPEIDILAPHYYTAAQFDELASHSTRPIIATEYSHAFGTAGFGGLQDRWHALTRHPAGAGGAIWMWADQGLRLPDGKLLLNDDGFDGIVSPDREPQRDYWETRAVYAQVHPAISRVTIEQDAQELNIPIQNDFDFIDLSEVETTWQIFHGTAEVAHGSSKLTGVAHSQVELHIPLTPQIVLSAPGTPVYIMLHFSRAGMSILDRSVEVLLPNNTLPLPPARACNAVSITHVDETVVLAAGEMRYALDRRTGKVVWATRRGVRVLGPLDLTLWRPMNENDRLMLKGDTGPFPDLNSYSTAVTRWKASTAGGDFMVDIAATHTIDTANSFNSTFHYTLRCDGTLVLNYEVRPHVHQQHLPFIGMTVHSPVPFTRAQWLGLGPFDSFPNEHAAANFGVWSLNPQAQQQESIKQTRWADLTAQDGRILRLTGNPYLRFSHGEVSALSAVSGRGSKRSLPERPGDQLGTADNQVFTGYLEIESR